MADTNLPFMQDWAIKYMEDRSHILAELKRLNKGIERLEERLGVMTVDITQLKMKAGIWGLTGGMIPVAIMLAIQFVGK